MDGIRDFLDVVRRHALATGRLRGLFHIAIGRRIARADGTVLSSGLTWRQLASELKDLRFDKDLVAQLGIDPDALSPRDRERFWYAAIGLANVDSALARAEADALIAAVIPHGFLIGPPPTAIGVEPQPTAEESARKRKKK